MLEEFAGLPLHPLVVHVPVVLVPLLVLSSLVYALVPQLRPRVGWVAVVLAVAAPASAVLARFSGEAYRDGIYPPADALPSDAPVLAHAHEGNWVMYSALALGAVTLALVFLRTGGGLAAPRWVLWIITVVLVVLAAVASWYVFQAGHTGAEMTHGGRLS